MPPKDVVKKLMRERGKGLNTIYFVACGGSLGGFYPACYLLRQASKHFRGELITSNEFVYAPPAACGPNALVVLCTMRGTKETCEAMDVAKARGAFTVGLYVEESALSRGADVALRYRSIADDEAEATQVNSNIALQIAFELLCQYEGYAHYGEAMEAFGKLDDTYRRALEISRPMAREFALSYADARVMYVMGAGASMGAAYIYSICNLMEMQGIHSAALNHGEFFHGPFEVTDEHTAFFVLKTAGVTRPMDERTIAFLRKYTPRTYVLDCTELGIDTFGPNVREYFNQSLLSPVLNNVFLRELSKATGRSHRDRVYMWKVAY